MADKERAWSLEGGQRRQTILYSQASPPSVTQSLIGRSEVDSSTSLPLGIKLPHWSTWATSVNKSSGKLEPTKRYQMSVLCSGSERTQKRSRNRGVDYCAPVALRKCSQEKGRKGSRRGQGVKGKRSQHVCGRS